MINTPTVLNKKTRLKNLIFKCLSLRSLLNFIGIIRVKNIFKFTNIAMLLIIILILRYIIFMSAMHINNINFFLNNLYQLS